MSDIPVTKIGELLDTVSSKLPTLVTNLLHSLYSEEAGIEMGKAVGGLYKELINSGLPQEVALKMASDYMVNLKDVMNVGRNSDGSVFSFSQTDDK